MKNLKSDVTLKQRENAGLSLIVISLRSSHPVQTLLLLLYSMLNHRFSSLKHYPKNCNFSIIRTKWWKNWVCALHTSNYPLQRSRGSQIIRKIFFADFCVQNNFAKFISRALICQTWAKILLSCTVVYIENSIFVFVQFMVQFCTCERSVL